MENHGRDLGFVGERREYPQEDFFTRRAAPVDSGGSAVIAGTRSEDRSKQTINVPAAPTRATTLPTDAQGRKDHPVASGVLDYFPDALVAIARVSKAGNDQHNPGQPLHWARGKSTDQDDTIIRHFLQRGSLDVDGLRHSAKMAWRCLALLQLEIEAERKLFACGAPTPAQCEAMGKKTGPLKLDIAGAQRNMEQAHCPEWKHPEWTPALPPPGSAPLPLGQSQNPVTREHVSTERVPVAQAKRDGVDEGTYRITVERERY